MAEGGGICVSGTVYDQIERKLALGYESLGEHNGQEYRQAGESVPGSDGARECCRHGAHGGRVEGSE